MKTRAAEGVSQSGGDEGRTDGEMTDCNVLPCIQSWNRSRSSIKSRHSVLEQIIIHKKQVQFEQGLEFP